MPDRSTPLSGLPAPQVVPGGAVGLNVTVRTERSFRGLTEMVRPAVDASRSRIVPHVVAALQSPESLWPVDTGLSKASFRGRGRGLQTTPGAYTAAINTALNSRGKTYANYVEAGVPNQPQNAGAARRTVARLRRRIIAAVQADIEAG